MAKFSAKPPTHSPDPNRRRCRQCGTVSTDLVAVEQRKLSGSLWSWYHLDCVPADRLANVYTSDPRVVAWQTNMWGKVHLLRSCAGVFAPRKVVTVDQIDATETGTCGRCARVLPPGSHYPFDVAR